MTAQERSDEQRSPDESAGPQPGPGRLSPGRSKLLRIFALLFVVVLSLLIVVYGDRLAGLGAYGYPGLFLLNLLASATLILPAPGIALAFAAGSALNPLLVGLAVGTGSTLGELTGYIAGASGSVMIKNDPRYPPVHDAMAKYGLWIIILLSLVPNPIFDIAGIVAGAMRIPVWQFLVAAWIGKVIKATLIALAGAGMIQALAPLVERWLAR